MSHENITRRTILQTLAGGTAATVARGDQGAAGVPTLTVKPGPRYELSPFLYMQFMEPLGVTDSSVEAAWDHRRDAWREDVVTATRDLAPAMIRWGGIFSDFYRWREGVGPRNRRVPMHNLQWGGIESNQVGTAEFVQFCRAVGAEPLMAVNFESDGRENYREARGRVRTADAREAADWVAYCNDPSNAERIAHGHPQPLTIRYWQLGNETSYSRSGFDLETAARKTIEFARAMRQSDPGIQLIAWGDSGWAARMAELAGEHVQFLAFHHMFNPEAPARPVLRGESYRRDPDATWQQLMDAWKKHDEKIREVREGASRYRLPLALTECHFSIPGRNRCEVLSTWAAGVSYARLLNTQERHGDVLKIATAADFCGTRWQVNAVMIPVPGGKSYLMPVARVMRLYRHHVGRHAVEITGLPDGLDVVASRTDNRFFLHVVNTRRTQSVRAQLAVDGSVLSGGRVFEIADDPMTEVSELNSDTAMKVAETTLPRSGLWDFPAASVSAVEIDV